MYQKSIFRSQLNYLSVLLIFLFLLATGFIVSANDDSTKQVPLPEIELFLEQGIYHWAEYNPLMKALYQTKAWEDVTLSSQSIGILTLATQLENQLGFQLSSKLVNELMKTPAEIALWNVFDNNKDMSFVIILDLQPEFLNIVKLAELYSKSMKKSTPIKKNNLELLETKWMKDRFFHVLSQNRLIVSNNLDCLFYVIGDSNNPVPVRNFRNSSFFKKYHQGQQGNFKGRINLSALLNNYAVVLNQKDLHLAFNLELNETVNYHSLFITATPGFNSSNRFSLENCIEFIPKEPLIAGGGCYPAGYYWELIKELPAFDEMQTEFHLDFDKELLPALGKNFFFYLNNLEENETDNIVNGVFGISLNKPSDYQKQSIEDVIRWIMTPVGGLMSQNELKEGIDILYFSDASLPAFCVMDRWVLVGSGVEALRECLAVFNKRAPSLGDSQEFKSLMNSFSRPGFGQVFVSPSRFFKSLGQHVLFLAKTATEFNAADVNHKILPVTEILEKMSTLGVFFETKENCLKGSIQFVDKK